MTFSLIGRDPASGAFGAAITTSDLAVGSRCVHLAHGQGAVLSQHRTDPRLGRLGLERLQAGDRAEQVVAAICRSTPDIGWRQVGVLDAAGRSAHHHGDLIYSIHTADAAPDVLAIGNILANADVTRAMADAFAAEPALPLAEKLLRGLEAGVAAGGEILGPLQSAALMVTGPDDIAACDLRIDISAECAVADLRRLFTAHATRADALRAVALRPDTVPVSARLVQASLDRIDALDLADRFPARRDLARWRVAD